MHVVTFCNTKGGVAKTTSSVNTAAALAKKGFKTLLVDLDSQSSATLHLGIKPSSKSDAEFGTIKSVADCFYRSKQINDSIVNYKDKLDIARGSRELGLLDLHLAHQEQWFLSVTNILEDLKSIYDFVILDTPPAFNATTINCVIASDTLVIVSPPSSLDVLSIHQIRQEIRDIADTSLYTTGVVRGILLTRTRKIKTMLAHTQYLRNYFDELIFDTEIKESVNFPESAANSLDVHTYKPRSASSKQYREFTSELLYRIM